MRLVDPDRMVYLISPKYVPSTISRALAPVALTAFS
jgi:hypothetical protein